MLQQDIHTYNSLLSRVGFDMNMMVDSIEQEVYPLDFVMSVALSQQQPQARLSCWVLTKLLDRNAEAVRVYIDRAIDFLPYATHSGQTREILRWFTICKPSGDNQLGALLDFCLASLQNFILPVAVKIHAMTIIHTIAKHEPEIIPEFAAILQDIEPYMSVGGKNKIHKLLALYNKQGLICNTL